LNRARLACPRARRPRALPRARPRAARFMCSFSNELKGFFFLTIIDVHQNLLLTFFLDLTTEWWSIFLKQNKENEIECSQEPFQSEEEEEADDDEDDDYHQATQGCY
jgi:hypothetical protein